MCGRSPDRIPWWCAKPRWSRATGAITAVPLLAGYNTPRLAIEPTWGVTAPLLCP
jgi:hypothetical protein